MPKCTEETVEFGRVGRRVVEAAFDGGDIVSDGGVLLLKRLDERLGLTRAAALAFGDERRSASVQHSLHSLLAQRIYGLCLGWSDVCDHNVLRNDRRPWAVRKPWPLHPRSAAWRRVPRLSMRLRCTGC